MNQKMEELSEIDSKRPAEPPKKPQGKKAKIPLIVLSVVAGVVAILITYAFVPTSITTPLPQPSSMSGTDFATVFKWMQGYEKGLDLTSSFDSYANDMMVDENAQMVWFISQGGNATKSGHYLGCEGYNISFASPNDPKPILGLKFQWQDVLELLDLHKVFFSHSSLTVKIAFDSFHHRILCWLSGQGNGGYHWILLHLNLTQLYASDVSEYDGAWEILNDAVIPDTDTFLAPFALLPLRNSGLHSLILLTNEHDDGEFAGSIFQCDLNDLRGGKNSSLTAQGGGGCFNGSSNDSPSILPNRQIMYKLSSADKSLKFKWSLGTREPTSLDHFFLAGNTLFLSGATVLSNSKKQLYGQFGLKLVLKEANHEISMSVQSTLIPVISGTLCSDNIPAEYCDGMSLSSVVALDSLGNMIDSVHIDGTTMADQPNQAPANGRIYLMLDISYGSAMSGKQHQTDFDFTAVPLPKGLFANTAVPPSGDFVIKDSETRLAYFIQRSSKRYSESYVSKDDSPIMVIHMQWEAFPSFFGGSDSVTGDSKIRRASLFKAGSQQRILVYASSENSEPNIKSYVRGISSFSLGQNSVVQPGWISYIIAAIICSSIVYAIGSALLQNWGRKYGENRPNAMKSGWSIQNIFHSLMQAFLYLQIAAFAFTPGIPWAQYSYGTTLQSVFSLLQFDITTLINDPIINSYFIVYLFVAIYFIVVVVIVRKGGKCPIFIRFVPAISSFLFIPTCKGLLAWLACTVIKTDISKTAIAYMFNRISYLACFPMLSPTLAPDQNWIAYILAISSYLCVLVFPIFAVLALSTKPKWQELNSPRLDFYYAPAFLVMLQSTKLLMVGLLTFLSGYDEVYLICMTAGSVFLGFFVLKTRPCTVHKGNLWHAVGSFFVAFNGIAGILAVYSGSLGSSGAFVPPLVLAIGWLLAIILIVLGVACPPVSRWWEKQVVKADDVTGSSFKIRSILQDDEVEDSEVALRSVCVLIDGRLSDGIGAIKLGSKCFLKEARTAIIDELDIELHNVDTNFTFIRQVGTDYVPVGKKQEDKIAFDELKSQKLIISNGSISI